MSVSLTALYAAVLALIMVALAINVTVHRARLKISLGDGGNPVMLRMMRLHGNAVEYIPIGLLLMLTYEIGGGSRYLLHAAGIALIAGRVIQIAAMWGTDIPNAGRGVGQTLTWVTIVVLALANLVKFF
jgi:uncharacterized protein